MAFGDYGGMAFLNGRPLIALTADDCAAAALTEWAAARGECLVLDRTIALLREQRGLAGERLKNARIVYETLRESAG